MAVFYEVRRWLLYKPNKEMKDFVKEFDLLIEGAEDNAEMPFSVWEKAVDIYIALQAYRKPSKVILWRVFL